MDFLDELIDIYLLSLSLVSEGIRLLFEIHNVEDSNLLLVLLEQFLA